MHLRKVIANPDRFDEGTFQTRRRDPTKPSFPDLLAAQAASFDPQNPPAAFPSLPLQPRPETNNSKAKPNTTASSISTACLQGGTKSDVLEQVNCERGAYESESVRENHFGQDAHTEGSIQAKSKAANTCDVCKRKIQVLWESLSLSVQTQIFSGLLKHQRYPEVVATTLKLTYSQLEDMKYQLNLRQLYNVPLESAWRYGAARGGLASNVINPGEIHEVMDYLLFASRYEVADEEEIKKGREFLRQHALNTENLDAYGDFDEEKILERTPSLAMHEHGFLKRRRSSVASTLTISSSIANRLSLLDRGLATAPASVTSLEQLPDDEKLNSNNVQRKRVRLKIDSDGRASLTHKNYDDRAFQPHRANTTDRATINRLSATSPEYDDKLKIHSKHNIKAFAAHFNRITFPSSERARLLMQDPEQMSNVDHWLVYGTSGSFIEHMIRVGITPGPALKPYDARKTVLNGSELKSSVLRALVDLHNGWVYHKAWEMGSADELIRKFDLTAETIMEKNLERQIIEQSSSQCAYPTINEKRRSRIEGASVCTEMTEHRGQSLIVQADCHERDKLGFVLPAPGVHSETQSDAILSGDSGILVNTLPESSSSVSQGSSSCLNLAMLFQRQPTNPDFRSLKSPTGDTTIEILQDTRSITKQGVRTFEAVASNDTVSKCGQIPVSKATAVSRTGQNASRTSLPDESHTISLKENTGKQISPCPPSFSPISDQDPDTLPFWATPKKSAVDEPKDCVSEMQQFQLAGRTPGAGLHRNHFQQRMLYAASEELIQPDVYSPIEHSPTNDFNDVEDDSDLPNEVTDNAINTSNLNTAKIGLSRSKLNPDSHYIEDTSPSVTRASFNRRSASTKGGNATLHFPTVSTVRLGNFDHSNERTQISSDRSTIKRGSKDTRRAETEADGRHAASHTPSETPISSRRQPSTKANQKSVKKDATKKVLSRVSTKDSPEFSDANDTPDVSLTEGKPKTRSSVSNIVASTIQPAQSSSTKRKHRQLVPVVSVPPVTPVRAPAANVRAPATRSATAAPVTKDQTKKRRSDVGKKRGPYKKKNSTATNSVTGAAKKA